MPLYNSLALSAVAVGLAVLGTASSSRTRNTGQQQGEPRLQRLVGSWVAISNSFVSPSETTATTMLGAPVAAGRAVYTLWKQGSGSATYEASGLWACDVATRRVLVFEANTLGLAAIHEGSFDSTGVLVLERRAPAAATVEQRSVLRWKGDTLWFDARFFAAGQETGTGSAVLVRRAPAGAAPH